MCVCFCVGSKGFNALFKHPGFVRATTARASVSTKFLKTLGSTQPVHPKTQQNSCFLFLVDLQCNFIQILRDEEHPLKYIELG